VWPHTAVVQAMRQRLQEPAQASQFAQRCQLIELVFGQIKHRGQNLLRQPQQGRPFCLPRICALISLAAVLAIQDQSA